MNTAAAVKPKAPPIPNQDSETIRRFVDILRGPEPIGCVEVRVLTARMDRNNFILSTTEYAATYAAWFDAADELAAEVGRVRGANVYVTVNPADDALLARQVELAKTRAATQDTEILCRRWVFVDVDAIRPADISSTDAELAAALGRRDTILHDHPELRAAAVWGCSGNGGWILIRVELPNDTPAERLVERCLAWLAARYTDAAVKIDPTVKNASRIMPLPGTVKCKGRHLATRPHRLATIDDQGADELLPIDLVGWLATHEDAPAPEVNGTHDPHWSVTATAGIDHTRSEADLRRQAAAAYLEHKDPAISGQHGHDAAFDAVCDMVVGFGLADDDARPMLQSYNVRCVPQWSDKELEHKIREAREKSTRPVDYRWRESPYNPDNAARNGHANNLAAAHGAALKAAAGPDRPPLDHDQIRERAAAFNSYSDLLRDRDFHGLLARLWIENDTEAKAVHADLAKALGKEFKARDFQKTVDAARESIEKQRSQTLDTALGDADRPRRGETIDDPHRLARLFLGQHFTQWGVPTLVHHRESFHRHDGTAYQPYRDIAADLTAAIKEEFERQHARAMMLYSVKSERGGTDEKPPQLLHVTTGIVNNTLQALRSETALTWDEAAPCWIGEGDWTDRDPLDILPAKNCLVHLPTLETLPHTPRLFSPFALTFDWHVNPPKPSRWLRFLNDELWPGDQESVRELQKWFGLALTLDTSYQKILMLIGPPRSGKGTVLRVLKDLVGEHNTTSPSLPSLARPFGLWGLLDKSLCIFADAHALGNRSERAVILECLLKISGEDNVTIDRKFLGPITTKLTARLMFVSNQPPNFREASGALVARVAPLQLCRTWKGREDWKLTFKLIAELPSILRHFAVDGLDMLKEDGGFRVPTSSRAMLENMSELLSPALQFGNECLDMVPADSRKLDALPVVADLFAAFCEWCAETKHESGCVNNFGRNLCAAYPHIKDHRPRDGEGDRRRRYSGIELNAEGQRLLDQARTRADRVNWGMVARVGR